MKSHLPGRGQFFADLRQRFGRGKRRDDDRHALADFPAASQRTPARALERRPAHGELVVAEHLESGPDQIGRHRPSHDAETDHSDWSRWHCAFPIFRQESCLNAGWLGMPGLLAAPIGPQRARHVKLTPGCSARARSRRATGTTAAGASRNAGRSPRDSGCFAQLEDGIPNRAGGALHHCCNRPSRVAPWPRTNGSLPSPRECRARAQSPASAYPRNRQGVCIRDACRTVSECNAESFRASVFAPAAQNHPAPPESIICGKIVDVLMSGFGPASPCHQRLVPGNARTQVVTRESPRYRPAVFHTSYIVSTMISSADSEFSSIRRTNA